MKKLLLSAWLMMLSIVAMAQTIVITDKDGTKVTYDVSKLEQITFQQDPPGFTVYEVVEETSVDPEQGQGPGQPTIEKTAYTFDEVASFAGDPDFLFAHPDTVYVGTDGQDFAFQLHTNVEYNYKPSAKWLSFSKAIAGTDSLSFEAGLNPFPIRRVGYIAFASKDEKIVDTLWVVQLGTNDINLTKCYNLKDNTISFDGGILPISMKSINIRHYELWTPENNDGYSPSVEETVPSDTYSFSFYAVQDYNDNVIYNKIWKRVYKFFSSGGSGDLETVEDHGWWTASSWNDGVHGSTIEMAKIQWKVDATAYRDYTQEWRKEKAKEYMKTYQISEEEALERLEKEKAYPDQKSQHPESPGFEVWTTNVIVSQPSYPNLKRDKFDDVLYQGWAGFENLSGADKGKQICFLEGNNYVYLTYIIMPNGDAVYVKALKDKSEANVKTSYYTLK